MSFPSFSEGLSLRPIPNDRLTLWSPEFPFLFGRAFIEATVGIPNPPGAEQFPFLFGRAFIEATPWCIGEFGGDMGFPSFSEGLSLRQEHHRLKAHPPLPVSLPFRKGFH